MRWTTAPDPRLLHNGHVQIVRNYLNEPLNWRRYQMLVYSAGIVLFSLGAKCFIDAGLGTDPLDVLVIGMNAHLGLGLGACSSIVAIVFLVWWMTWNRKLPPLSPFVSTAAVGFLLDFWNAIELERFTIGALPVVDFKLFGHAVNFNAVALDIVALLACSYASALIIMSGIGIRIMDLVAITMIEKWGWSFFRAKMTLEVALFTSGMVAWRADGYHDGSFSHICWAVHSAVHVGKLQIPQYPQPRHQGARRKYDARLILHRSTPQSDATGVRGSLLLWPSR